MRRSGRRVAPKYQEPEAVNESDLPELPEGWCWASLEALSPAEHPIVYGIILPGEHVEGGIPFIRPVDIQDNTVSLDRLPRTSPEIAEKYRRAALAEGDLVYSIVGTIGKWLIVPATLEGANINQSSVRIRPLPPIDVHYFVRVLQSPLLAGQISRLQFGNAVQRLNVDHVRKLVVPLPPAQEWQAIRVILDKRTKALRQVENQVGQVMGELKELDQAILSKAFRGELVPQDPNDEPASALLDRIRAERQAEGKGRSASSRQGRLTGLD